MQTVVENGVFRIPLYHGTSSAFLESIETLGLGAFNPIAQYGVASLLRGLLAACDEAFDKQPDWNADRFATQWMVDQESFRDDANFQHGDTYLSPSRASAVGYALTNRFGSELITQAHRLYCLLEERQPQALQNLGLHGHPVVSLFRLEPKPVIVVARNVPVAAVAAEGGGPPHRSIEQLQDLCTFLGQTGVVLNVNFRLRVPLSPGSFSVEFVEEGERNPFEW